MENNSGKQSYYISEFEITRAILDIIELTSEMKTQEKELHLETRNVSRGHGCPR